MSDIHEQAEIQLQHFKSKAVGTHTLSTKAFIDLLYKTHPNGQRRGNYAPLASVEYAISTIRDIPAIEEDEKKEVLRKWYEYIKDIPDMDEV